MSLVINCKNGISSYEVARDLGVTQKTAWFMLHRLRLAMQDGSVTRLSGEVEADETFIGGKARNMHLAKKARRITGTGTKDKTAVMGILERGGKVRTTVVPNHKKSALQAEVKNMCKRVRRSTRMRCSPMKGLLLSTPTRLWVMPSSTSTGRIHTNGLENFWSLLKRGINGPYISVEPFRLFRYLDEQTFRYNNRKNVTDKARLGLVLSQIAGKRLTYAELTGKMAES